MDLYTQVDPDFALLFQSVSLGGCTMDWANCIVCGKSEGELKCPADRSSGDAHDTYQNFLDNIEGFRVLDKMPAELAIDLGTGVSVDDLLKNRAKWHKNCNLKFASSKLQRAQQRCKDNETTASDSGRKSRRLSSAASVADCRMECCIFCTKPEGSLHNCSTFSLDKSLREMATELQDTELLSRLAGGDLVAIEAKYHNNCLRNYKNRYRGMQRKQQTLTSDTLKDEIDSRVFAELASYIENEVEEGVYIFKLSDLHHLHEE